MSSLLIPLLITLEKVLDKVIISTGEMLKALVQEIWKVGAQLIYLFSILILRVLSRGAFNYQLERRHRIRSVHNVKEDSIEGDAAVKSKGRNDDDCAADNIFENLVVAAEDDDDDDDDDDDTQITQDGKDKSSLASSFLNSSFATFLSSPFRRPSIITNEENIEANDNGSPPLETAKQTTSTTTTTTKTKRTLLSSSRRHATPPRSDVKRKSRFQMRIRQDAVRLHETRSTGLLEDLMLFLMLCIERSVTWLRALLPKFEKTTTTTTTTTTPVQPSFWHHPSNPSLPLTNIDCRDVSSLVRDAGYPFESHLVTTVDGYLLRLDRLPRRSARRAVYMQHGILDSSFAWVASGATGSLAFQAYELGYDVWLGNFRGAANSCEHVKGSSLSQSEYWDFNVDDHAHSDLAAMIAHIHLVKREEAEAQRKQKKSSIAPLDLSVIAHSMGAASVLMYLTRRGLEKRAHGVTRAILLSPAGLHKTAPLMCKLLGPVINFGLLFLPFIHHITLRSRLVRYLLTKAMLDVRAASPVRSIFVRFLTFTLGGSPTKHPFATIHNLAYNSFGAATSIGVYKHFWQLWKSKRFQAFDYGAKRNLELYGTSKPLDYMRHYDRLDIPIYLGMGLADRLIEPVSVIGQYEAIRSSGGPAAKLVRLKSLPECGHIELVLSLDDRASRWIIHCLQGVNEKKKPDEMKEKKKNMGKEEVDSDDTKIDPQ